LGLRAAGLSLWCGAGYRRCRPRAGTARSRVPRQGHSDCRCAAVGHPRSHRLRNPDQLRRRERYRQNPSPKGVKVGRRYGVKFERRLTNAVQGYCIASGSGLKDSPPVLRSAKGIEATAPGPFLFGERLYRVDTLSQLIQAHYKPLGMLLSFWIQRSDHIDFSRRGDAADNSRALPRPRNMD
jgi:hypothetical protein